MIYNALNPMKAKSLDAGKYADGQGLWLFKRTKQAGKWILRISVAGHRREMGLGGWPSVGLAEARERAEAARRKVRDGQDPITERTKAKAKAKKLSVRAAVNGCFAARQADLKGDGKAGRWMSPLSTHVLPKLGKLPIEDLDQHAIKRTLAPIWHQKPDSARKALNRINLTIKHAAALGLEVDIQAAEKARALLGKQRHVAKHIPSLPYRDAPAFYQSLVQRDHQMSCLALRFLMLTLCRTSELRFAMTDHVIDGVWEIPAEHTKTSTLHRVPLTEEAVRVIKLSRALQPSERLFPAPRGGALSDATMARFMERQKMAARPHGFRATFRTWAEETQDVSSKVAEACLGHVVDGEVERAYQRSDRFEKRRELLLEWEQYLLALDPGAISIA
ncbi:tyrosine-type recombinase/integrase [Yoonia sp. 2307UL14-13]|uniref:tyrosine-type recombinase/integrase n=1 Tax=Yoonia sp. 2307UL14-13 TaxID=3126506 RepID=UPI0030B45E71